MRINSTDKLLQTFTTQEVENRIPKVQECINNLTPFYVLPGYDTTYMLVYGTLRTLRGNWEYFLQNVSNHIDTIKMVGYCKNKGIATEYTGDQDHYTVMDLFEIKEGEDVEKINAGVDSLEGSPTWYRPILVPMEVGEETVLAKFYEMPWRTKNNRASSHDYLENFMDNLSNTERNILKEVFPKSYEFYFPNTVNTHKIENVTIEQ